MVIYSKKWPILEFLGWNIAKGETIEQALSDACWGHFNRDDMETCHRFDERGDTKYSIEFSGEFVTVTISVPSYYAGRPLTADLTAANLENIGNALSVWEGLRDIPVDDNEDIEIALVLNGICNFEVGTNKYEVKHWIEENLNTSIAWLMGYRVHPITGEKL